MERRIGVLPASALGQESRRSAANGVWWSLLAVIAAVVERASGSEYFGFVSTVAIIGAMWTIFGALSLKAAEREQLRVSLRRLGLDDVHLKGNTNFTATLVGDPVRGRLELVDGNRREVLVYYT